MTETTEIHIESARLQKEIEAYIGMKSANIIFDFHEIDGMTKLDIVTVNPTHRQSFLFHSVTGYDRANALGKMLDYVKIYKEKESPYTVQWSLKDDDELHTSYFRAKNISTALDKFYYGRDPNSTVIFSVVMNPIT
ncbi:MAG: hypothetical protein COA57_07745 [Flavobacteriales bacterium]|nr:MAG: hypothetical protein COA57_07745 [Flavobacteriales bacterium]